MGLQFRIYSGAYCPRASLLSLSLILLHARAQYIFASDFEKPFFLTYFSTSHFAVYNLGFLISRSWRQRCDVTPQCRRSRKARALSLQQPAGRRSPSNVSLVAYRESDEIPAAVTVDHDDGKLSFFLHLSGSLLNINVSFRRQ